MATPDKSRFIQDITIRNFKCFEELKIEGCGQFNLILGDNNVGKTSVLEALLVEGVWNQETVVIARLQRLRLDKYGENPRDVLEKVLSKNEEPLQGLMEVFARGGDSKTGFSIGFKRRTQDDWPPFIMQLKLVRELDEGMRQTVRALRIRGQAVLWMKHGEDHTGSFTPLSEPLYTGLEFPFVSTKSFYGPDLIDFYSKTVSPSTAIKSQFVEALTGMIPNLTDVEILIDPVLGPQIIARLSDQDRVQPLAFFGDGSIKLARILLQLPLVKNNRLMIDEIDAGIHYSRFATLWRTTLLAAIANNVQLFITTHNMECLRALQEVLDTDPELMKYQDECRAFTLQKLPDGNVKAYRHSFSQFENALRKGYELRGGVL